MTPLLILRAEPGAGETLARARDLGLEAVTAPIFSVRPLDWDAPAPGVAQAVMLTSANAARHGGDALAALTHLPCYAIGEATAEAARGAGFGDIRIGPGDGAALIETMASSGITNALHLCGREHIPLSHPDISIERRIVYTSEPITPLPAEAAAALDRGSMALLHSPRMAAHFASLVDRAGFDRQSVALAAISRAAADAAGGGWKSVAVASSPRDAALLELATKLCQTARAGAG